MRAARGSLLTPLHCAKSLMVGGSFRNANQVEIVTTPISVVGRGIRARCDFDGVMVYVAASIE